MRFLKLLSLLLLFIVVAFPYVAKFGVIHFLENEFDVQVNIDDLSANLFTGFISLDGLHIYGEAPNELHLGHASVNIDMKNLFDKKVLVEKIFVSNLKSSVIQTSEQIDIGGITIPMSHSEKEQHKPVEKHEAKSDWGIGVNTIQLSNCNIDIQSLFTDSQFNLKNLTIENAYSWLPKNQTFIDLSLVLNNSPIDVDSKIRLFDSPMTIDSKININQLAISPFLKSIDDLPIEKFESDFISDINLSVSISEENTSLTIDGVYGLNNTSIEDDWGRLDLDSLTLDGRQDLTINEKGTQANISGGIKLSALNIDDIKNKLSAQQKSASLDGEFQILLPNNQTTPGITSSSTLKLSRFKLEDLDNKTLLIAYDDWSTNEINIKSIDDIKVGRTELTDFIFLQSVVEDKSTEMASLNKFLLTDVSYSPRKMTIEKLKVSGLKSSIEIDKNGKLKAIEAIREKISATSSQTETAAMSADHQEEIVDKPSSASEKNEASDPFQMILNELLVTDSQDISFVDRSVLPEFNGKIKQLEVSVKHLDTHNSNRPTKISVTSSLNEYAKLSLKGEAYPFTDQLNANLAFNLDGFEMVPISSYSGKHAGISIKRGVLNVNSDIKIVKNVLDITNTFQLNQLTVESDDKEVEKGIFSDMPMPLDFTLDVLRDKNNVIKLDIPVKGNISEPDFHLQDVYNTAMAKAMKFAATHYLTQAVQPLGLIMTAGKLVGKAMTPRFDPLIFPAGSAELSDKNIGHLEKIGELLHDKEKLSLTICGSSVSEDRVIIIEKMKQALGDKFHPLDSKDDVLNEMLKLANLRTKNARNYLVENHSIEVKRLFKCNGKFDIAEEAKPRVDISL